MKIILNHNKRPLLCKNIKMSFKKYIGLFISSIRIKKNGHFTHPIPDKSDYLYY